MGFVRVDVRVFLQGSRKPILKLVLDETTLGRLTEVANFVQALPIFGGRR